MLKPGFCPVRHHSTHTQPELTKGSCASDQADMRGRCRGHTSFVLLGCGTSGAGLADILSMVLTLVPLG